ncbi:MAG: hypothetical protein JSS66_07460 [Armatimonadetes bacterium]|nr:hypothetical protein [Armatimonadota bacterium]
MATYTVLAGSGDLKLSYDPANKDQVAAAKKVFNDLVKKGMKVYVDTKSKSRRKEVTEFSPTQTKLVFVPQLTGGMSKTKTTCR